VNSDARDLVGKSVDTNISTGTSVRVAEETYPDKGIHGSPYVVRKPKQADGIALTRFVANLNLALKLDVTRPLKDVRVQWTGI